ncbi:MAG TPA: methyltransferase domain-containing protein [Ktedonobacteraceae bacterium]|nr:methyltransferase domain-containing protein [Ktedonobacteraceae bacterium]
MQSESNRTHYAAAFKDRQVVDAYKYRLPYPQEVFEILAELITGEPRTVLDVGAGSGDIARNCVAFAERVDAVDFSQNMLERGKQLPNGNDPRLHWIYGKIEEALLTPPYALITAGSSIHWMDWPRAFPRFRSVLAPNGLLALIYRRALPMPWDDELKSIRARFNTRQGIRGANAVGELERRGFLHKIGQRETMPMPFQQSIDDFIEELHSRSTFAREFMGVQKAEEFDQQVRALLLHAHPDGMLPLQMVGNVIWGTPESGSEQ